ncbi:hypothetical protein TUM19329_28020 [Legionella antarctica]|uniref:Protein translocase subunit SecA n=1 Tax=Legionella antarctica TaxID=2708020 RepID=A0A6F8T7L1_9GAMM|nr:hypothetical protein [Legionella antarctica]BCA96441.1 hypothetical protein TUM19329_28020 [Legionella antarctica]
MKIILNELSFTSIKDFTSYLETNYEKDPLPATVHLKINYDAINSQNNSDLIDFLQTERRCIYKLNLIPEPLSKKQAAFNQLLNKVYLKNTGQHGCSDFTEELPVSIRKAKKNWVEEKKVSPLGLQIFKRPLEKTAERRAKTTGLSTFAPEDGLIIDLVHRVVEQADPELDSALLRSLTDKLNAVIATKGKEVPTLVYGLTLLLKAYRANGTYELIRFHNLLGTLELTNEHTLSLWMKILISFGENSKSEDLGLLLDLHKGLVAHGTMLNSIASLFDNLPYPDLNQLVIELGKNKKELKKYIDFFDKDPKAIRAPQYDTHGILIKSSQKILEEQFDTAQVHRVITKMKNLVDEGRLTNAPLHSLAQQVIYINAIGKDHPLTVDNKQYTNLTNVSRSELNTLSKLLIARVRNPVLIEHAKTKAQLNLLAVMREQYFRTTGQFIDTTQILSILMSMQNQQSNMLLEIGSEERKNATTPLLAAMQWVAADGGTVDVCMGNRGLVKENYLDNGVNHFFTVLDIPTAVIEADDPAGTFQVGGINYSTVVDLVIYRSRATSESDALTVKKLGQPLSSNLIINAIDFSTVDDRIVFDLVENSKNEDDLNETVPNPYIWIYPLVDEFIKQKEFKNLDSSSGDVWDEEQDRENLKRFLNTHATTELQREQLIDLSDLKLNSWINLACRVQQLVEGEDFDVYLTQTSGIAVPGYQSVPQTDCIFGRDAQHFIHAHLQKKYPSKTFLIESETEIIDSVPAKDLFDHYKEHGRIVGIFTRIARSLDDQNNLLNAEVAFQMPSHHKKSERDSIDTPLVVKKAEHLEKIKRIVTQARSGQPVVLLATDENHVKDLFHELSNQFKNDGNDIRMGAFTGEESEETRINWAVNCAGQINTITIATSLLIKDITFNTEHEHGFLGIQTFLEAPGKTGKFIDQLSPNGKPGQYVAIYEEEGTIFSNSWPFQPEANRKSILDEVGRIQRKKNQELAVERYYTQTVATMQLTVLKQFDEWQAFLHLLYPQNVWKKLDHELFVQREDLIVSLVDQWSKCLTDSDPGHVYSNPYVRRDSNKKLQTAALDNALQDYEKGIELIWKTHRNVLKEKTESKIQEESVNALRRNYLEGVMLSDQLRLQNLALRHHKKTTALEQKKTSRVVDSGLDVNGAMLVYSDVSKNEYRSGFAKSQLKLLVKDTIREIERSSLSANVKYLFIKRLSTAGNFLALEQVLKDYHARDLPEKYRMQPILCELIRIYKYSGIPETKELQELKGTYIGNVAFEIAENLELSLSWSLKENRGFFYWLERTAVKTAAQEILIAVDEVKKATDTPSRQLALKNLYKLLIQHQAQLEGLWIFSFGHQNTSTLINQTLETLETLTVIGSGQDQLDGSFIHKCQEDAHSDLMKKQFKSALNQIEEQHNPWLENNLQWNTIKDQIHSIQRDNNTVYVIDDLYYFLSRTSKELNQSNSQVYKPVIELRGELRTIWNKFSQKHQELIKKTNHFDYKAAKLQEHFQGIEGYVVGSVRITPVHTGFHEYYDLIIEGSGSIPLFDSFMRYNSRVPVLNQERTGLESLQEQNNARIRILQELQQKQLPLLHSREYKQVDQSLFPESYHALIQEVLLLKDYVAGKVPDDLNGFSEKEQNLFFDRNLLKDFDSTDFTLEQINHLKDQQLKSDFIELYNKIRGINSEPAPSFFSRFVSLLVRPLFPQETSEDWRYQFAGLKGIPDTQLSTILQPQIDKKIQELASHLAALEIEAVNGTKPLADQIEYLAEKIDEEHSKNGVFIKRFENLDQLYDFEIELRNFKASQSFARLSGTQLTMEASVLEENEFEATSQAFSCCEKL